MMIVGIPAPSAVPKVWIRSAVVTARQSEQNSGDNQRPYRPGSSLQRWGRTKPAAIREDQSSSHPQEVRPVGETRRIGRGDIVAVDLEPVRGSEIGKRRPCLVISNDTANRYAATVVVAAVTSATPTRPYPFMVQIPSTVGLPRQSWVNCSQIRTVSKDRLGRFFDTLDDATMRDVNRALMIHLELR